MSETRVEEIAREYWRARALKYEQALREIGGLAETYTWSARTSTESLLIDKIHNIARAALDKPEGK